MKSGASRRWMARVLMVAAAGTVLSCGNDDPGPEFTVGAGDAVESRVLAEVYAGALARTGLRVAVEPGLGERGDYLGALDEGRVALVGEHTGALLAHFDDRSEARTPDDVLEALNRSLPEGLVVADPAEGADLRARVLVAESENADAVADLAPRCAEMPAGVAPEPDLVRGPAVTVADCSFAGVVELPDAVALREALLDGRIRAGILNGPLDDERATEGLTVLADDDFAVRAENVIPLFRKGSLDDRRVRKLNYVAGELTADELLAMIERVRGGADAGHVAREWLDAHAL